MTDSQANVVPVAERVCIVLRGLADSCEAREARSLKLEVEIVNSLFRVRKNRTRLPRETAANDGLIWQRRRLGLAGNFKPW